MKKIRIGNDFICIWSILRAGDLEDLTTAISIKLWLRFAGRSIEIATYSINVNVITIDITPELASAVGNYALLLEYTIIDSSLSDGIRNCAVDVDAFTIVPRTAQADDDTLLPLTADVAAGIIGKSAYQSYLDTTSDDPPMTEQEWSDLITTHETTYDHAKYVSSATISEIVGISQLEYNALPTKSDTTIYLITS